jgi:predicted enzyme related to lactoylglutathione lyase
MLKLSSILIGVSNLEKARPFYEKVLGLKFDEFRPPFASAYLGDIEFNIEEDAPYRKPGWAKQNIGGRKNISLLADDIDAFLKEAVAQGARVVSPVEVQPWGWKEAIIADPDGNEFIIDQEASA